MPMPPSPMRERMRYGPICSGSVASSRVLSQVAPSVGVSARIPEDGSATVPGAGTRGPLWADEPARSDPEVCDMTATKTDATDVGKLSRQPVDCPVEQDKSFGIA